MKLLASFVLLVLGSSQGIAAADCPDKFEVFDNTRVQLLPGTQGCMMSLSPRNYEQLTYRSFLFYSNGLFMVFNSFGPGNDSTSSGAREYYFFPRQHELSYHYDAASKRVHLRSASGKVFIFNTEKAILLSISDTEFTAEDEVHSGNKGGIEITRNNGLYLDLGFKIGQSPSQNPKGKIRFKDSQNNICSVTNSEIFNYTADLDAIFKYSDDQLPRFLSKRCPMLNL